MDWVDITNERPSPGGGIECDVRINWRHPGALLWLARTHFELVRPWWHPLLWWYTARAVASALVLGRPWR